MGGGNMNMMTEAEAKTKWCPMVRTQPFIGAEKDCWATTNRGWGGSLDVVTPLGTKCLASDCMLWQWDNAITDGPRKGRCGLSR